MAKKKKITPKRRATVVAPVKDNNYYTFATELVGGGYRLESDLFKAEEIDIEMHRGSVEHNMVLLRLVPTGIVLKEPSLKQIDNG